jgi:hypothetical protein
LISPRILAIGFCTKSYNLQELPGWWGVSWAWHSDDGKIYVNRELDIAEPTPDFGPGGTFGAGDTVGVGIDVNTGEGFCTLNGARRDVGECDHHLITSCNESCTNTLEGDAFKKWKFKGRKLFPCVGVDMREEGVGLRFVLNFGGSTAHEFEYHEMRPQKVPTPQTV